MRDDEMKYTLQHCSAGM